MWDKIVTSWDGQEKLHESKKEEKYNGGEVQVRHFRSEQNDAAYWTQKKQE